MIEDDDAEGKVPRPPPPTGQDGAVAGEAPFAVVMFPAVISSPRVRTHLIRGLTTVGLKR